MSATTVKLFLISCLHSPGLVSRHPYSQQHRIDANALHYVGRFDNPATQFSLRAIDPERYQIINEAEGGYVMEEIEESKAFFQVYDGSVYMFQVDLCDTCTFSALC